MKNILLIFVTILFLSSCEKTEYELADATPELLLAASKVKKWEMIDPTVKLVVGSSIPVIKPAAPAGEVSNGLGYFYFIFLDKTIRFQDGYGTTASDKAVVNGTWDFTDSSKTSLSVTLSGVTKTWIIKELTPSRLTIEIDGVSHSYMPTPGNP